MFGYKEIYIYNFILTIKIIIWEENWLIIQTGIHTLYVKNDLTKAKMLWKCLNLKMICDFLQFSSVCEFLAIDIFLWSDYNYTFLYHIYPKDYKLAVRYGDTLKLNFWWYRHSTIGICRGFFKYMIYYTTLIRYLFMTSQNGFNMSMWPLDLLL